MTSDAKDYLNKIKTNILKDLDCIPVNRLQLAVGYSVSIYYPTGQRTGVLKSAVVDDTEQLVKIILSIPSSKTDYLIHKPYYANIETDYGKDLKLWVTLAKENKEEDLTIL